MNALFPHGLFIRLQASNADSSTERFIVTRCWCYWYSKMEAECIVWNEYSHHNNANNAIIQSSISSTNCLGRRKNTSQLCIPWLLYQHPDSKVHRANMGPIWGRQDPDGPHVGPMNLAIRVFSPDIIDHYLSVPRDAIWQHKSGSKLT